MFRKKSYQPVPTEEPTPAIPVSSVVLMSAADARKRVEANKGKQHNEVKEKIVKSLHSNIETTCSSGTIDNPDCAYNHKLSTISHALETALRAGFIEDILKWLQDAGYNGVVAWYKEPKPVTTYTDTKLLMMVIRWGEPSLTVIPAVLNIPYNKEIHKLCDTDVISTDVYVYAFGGAKVDHPRLTRIEQ